MTIPRNSIFGAQCSIRNAQYTCWVSVDYDFAHTLTYQYCMRLVSSGLQEAGEDFDSTKHTRLARKLGGLWSLDEVRHAVGLLGPQNRQPIVLRHVASQLAEASFVWRVINSILNTNQYGWKYVLSENRQIELSANTRFVNFIHG